MIMVGANREIKEAVREMVIDRIYLILVFRDLSGDLCCLLYLIMVGRLGITCKDG